MIEKVEIATILTKEFKILCRLNCFPGCGMGSVTHFLKIKNGDKKELKWLGKPGKHVVTKQPS